MNEYFLTFIIFADKLDKLNLTLESMYGCLEKKKMSLQLVIVDETNTAKENEFESRMTAAGARFDYLDLTEENREEILELAFSAARGTYVSITKCGVLYREDHLYRIYRYAQKSNEDRILAPTVSGRNSPIMKEVFAFQRKHGKNTDLENNYHIIHCNYAGYFIKKSAWSKERCLDSCWTLAVMKKLFYTVTSDARIGYAGKVRIFISSTTELMQPWEDMIRGDCLTFCRSFLAPVFAFCKTQDVSCKNNAKYNLVYYCCRILDNINAEEQEPEQLQEIRRLTEEIMAFIVDDEIILFNQFVKRDYKYYLEKKFHWENKTNPEVAARRKNVLSQSYAGTIYQFVEAGADKISLECRSTMFLEEEFRILFAVNGTMQEGIPKERVDVRDWFGESACVTRYALCEIPVSASKEYRVKVYCEARGELIEKKSYTFGNFMPLSADTDLFYQENGWNIYFDQQTAELVFAPKNKKDTARLKRRRLISLLKENNASRKSLAVRMILSFLKARKKKEIWLISDRSNRADDNGEIFFRYVCRQNFPNVQPYFVVSKEVPDFKRMKQYGKVVSVYSWKHKMLHLLCDYVISSQANKPVINPFGAVGHFCYSDLIAKKKIVFLQHGVTKDDQSQWLNRYNRNLYGLVVNTMPEYNSILEYDYYYTPKQVWLTGMPRYDALTHDEKGYITIMPTWRKSLSDGADAAGVWKVRSDFADSDYFMFYNALLNDERLIAKAKECGYTICFMPHPNIKPALGLFVRHPDVVFFDDSKAYREVFAESNLLVTDYSSVVFDFAYLRKPIVYCQFDREEFFSGGHSYVEGYYNYMEDGFGEVEDNLQGLIDRVIEYMEQGCVLKEKYAERIQRTFAYHDKECCKRVAEKILGKTLSEERESEIL